MVVDRHKDRQTDKVSYRGASLLTIQFLASRRFHYSCKLNLPGYVNNDKEMHGRKK